MSPLAGFEVTAYGRISGDRRGLLFGIGAETFNISTLAAVTEYFAGRNLAFATGLNLAIGRAGSFSADMSPAWFAHA